jgi:Family of unknown function (DUF5719)
MINRVIALISTTLLLAAGLVFAPPVQVSVDLGSASGSFDVKPADQSVVCPGPLFVTGGASGTDLGAFDRTGSTTLRYSADGTGLLEVRSIAAGDPALTTLGAGRIYSVSEIGNATELKNTGASVGSPQGSMVVTASTSQVAGVDSMRGLAAASCQQPSNDIWLVGGSTAPGREALLILTNPTPIDATADLKIYSDLGEIEVAGLSGISVLANSTAVLSLASFAPTVATMAVQVQTSGAKLAGWIQHRVMNGTESLGVDLVSPSPAPQLVSVIPGFVIRGTEAINQIAVTEGIADAGHKIRVFAPTGATVTIQIVSTSPEVFGAVLTGVVEPGAVLDFPVTELLDGNYSVFVTGDQPIFATAKAAIGNDGGTPRMDFAWTTASEPITTSRAVMTSGIVPPDGASYIVLGNPLNEVRSATITSLETGVAQVVSVPALGSAEVAITGAVAISGDSEIYASVALIVSGQNASMAIYDPTNVGNSVLVRFR